MVLPVSAASDIRV